MRDKHGLLSAPIPETLRTMTIPMIFGMIAILMFNLVDTFFISLLGTQALAAISFTFPVTFTVNCITMGIGMGISTCIGRLLGQGNSENAARFTSHALLLAVVLVTLASTIGLYTIPNLFGLLGAQPELIPLIEQYMQVWYLTIPLLVIQMAGVAKSGRSNLFLDRNNLEPRDGSVTEAEACNNRWLGLLCKLNRFLNHSLLQCITRT